MKLTDGFKKGQQIIGVGHTLEFILSVIRFLTTCKLTIESAQCIATYGGGGKYQVNNIHGGMYVVDLERHMCTCRKWDLCRIPCSHSMVAIAKTEKSTYDFVHSLYKRAAYDRAYESYISPMPSQEYWRKIGHRPIKPSLYHKQPGRLRTSR
ncbi:unnamed protein product [Prunus armeniaca]